MPENLYYNCVMMNEIELYKLNKAIAKSCLDAKDIDGAIKYYEEYFKQLKTKIEENSDNQAFIDEYNSEYAIYSDFLFNKAKSEYAKKNWLSCTKYCKKLIESKKCDSSVYKHAGLCFRHLKQFDEALDLLLYYNRLEPEDPANLCNLAEAYYNADKNKYAKKALELYTKFVEKNPTSAPAYNAMGQIYATTQDKEVSDVQKQLYYFSKARELAPKNKTIARNVVLTYEKMGDLNKASILYDEIYKSHKEEFTHDDFYDYAAFKIKTGDFIKGWSLLDHRFQKETSPTFYPNIEKPLWNGQTHIANKTLLVHCEQGFGDVIMYIRFVHDIKKFAKNVITIVQGELLDLFKESNLDFPIYPRFYPLKKLNFDYQIPMMSLPRILKTTPQSIPSTGGYLTVRQDRVDAFKNAYIKTNKFKIGICLEGAASGKKEERDVDWSYLEKFGVFKNIQFYCLKNDLDKEFFKKTCPSINVECFGSNLKSFADTAAAIKNMDLIISTDNVILNLSGALGVKTFGLYNLNREYRWYGVEEGKVIWYDSVKPFQAKVQNEWDNVIDDVIKNIKALNVC